MLPSTRTSIWHRCPHFIGQSSHMAGHDQLEEGKKVNSTMFLDKEKEQSEDSISR